MSRFPTASAYQEALQHPDEALIGPRFDGAAIAETFLGLPRAYSGAMAVVFPLNIRGERWALKCFVGHAGSVEARYRAITRYVTGEGLERFDPGELLPDAIRIDGRTYPTLLTPWRPGINLHAFIERHRNDSAMLGKLAEAWLDLASELEATEFAHGDLQHGNVLVQVARGRPVLHLIDFDGAYVPSLRRRGAVDTGHRNYQHPDRSSADFGPHIDRFPALVIYVAIRAVASRPDLWPDHDTGENLLFTADSLFDPASSTLFERLRDVPEVAGVAASLEACCLLATTDVPALADVIEHGVLRPADAVRRRSDDPARPRGAFETYFMPAAVSWLLASVLAAFTGRVHASAIMLVLGAGAFFLLALYVFRRRPEQRRRRKLLREIDYARRTIADLNDERKAVEVRRQEYVSDREEMRRRRLSELREDALRDSLKHHFVHEAVADGGVPHKAVLRLKRAGIRTAFQADDDALKTVTQTSVANLDRVRGWRRGLVERYAGALPEALSPAESRRLERQIDARLSGYAAEASRVAERVTMQERIIRELTDRLEAIHAMDFGTYMLSMLRLRPFPDDHPVTFRRG